MLRELDILLRIDEIDGDLSLSELESGFHRVGQSRERGFFVFPRLLLCDYEAVDNGFDGVLFVAIEFDLILEGMNRAIDTRAGETGLANLFEDSLIRSFAGSYKRRKDQDPRAIRKLLDPVHNLLG